MKIIKNIMINIKYILTNIKIGAMIQKRKLRI